jgi:hypothetical protein
MSDYFERIEAHLLDALDRQATPPARRGHLRRIAQGRWLSRRPVLAAGGIFSVGVPILLALLLSAGTDIPAYAVVARPDGTVVLTLNEIVGVDPANARLAKLGVRARLLRTTAGCRTKARPVPWTVAHNRVLPGDQGTGKLRSPGQMRRVAERLAASNAAILHVIRSMIKPQHSVRGVSMIIHPSAIPHGLTLVLAFKPVNPVHDNKAHAKPRVGVGGSIALYRNPVPSCLSTK